VKRNEASRKSHYETGNHSRDLPNTLSITFSSL
jgi:hypothetical protein